MAVAKSSRSIASWPNAQACCAGVRAFGSAPAVPVRDPSGGEPIVLAPAEVHA